MSDKKTGKKCVVCVNGEIVERTHIPYIAAINLELFGPGGKNIATEKDRIHDGFYCSKCGLVYYKLPQD